MTWLSDYLLRPLKSMKIDATLVSLVVVIVDSTLRGIMLSMPSPECEYEVGDAAVFRKHVFHVISDENKMILI